jgi:cytochrome oxidase assembly protein ShyY1
MWTLRQRRYAAMAALMLVLALGCVAAGTWQIQRFEQSVHDNRALDRNAHGATAPLSTELVPLVGTAKAPGRDAIRFRTVTVSGTYLPGTQYVRGKVLNNSAGYYVLSALKSADGVVLVVRGFIADDGHGAPNVVAPPPSGVVEISGRLQTPSTAADAAALRLHGEVDSVNPVQQATRRGVAVYDAYLDLLAKQPGTAGLAVLPAPDLSNPAGGAFEAQHFAYIIQWYLFGLLALIAPFVLARHEVRAARLQFLGIDEGEQEFGLDPGVAPIRVGSDRSGSRAELALRSSGGVAKRDASVSPEFQRAERLADRYGRSLRIDGVPSADPGTVVAAAPAVAVPGSSVRPHRSPDAYHGSYNDYLWQLGLADGQTPEVEVQPRQPNPGHAAIEPVVLDMPTDGGLTDDEPSH